MPNLTVGPISIHYELHGEGPPVVLLSGFVAGASIWQPVKSLLASEHTCLVLDNRGVGRTDAPAGAYSIEMLAADVEGLMTGLGIRRPLVVGHSMGGFVAMMLALSRAVPPAGLVLISTAASGISRETGISQAAIHALFRARGPRREIVQGVLDLGLGADIRQRPGRVDEIRRLLLASMPSPSGFLGQKAAVETFDIRSRLQDIEVPCRIVHGEEDAILPVSNGAYLRDALPEASLRIIPGVGHFPHLEVPEMVAEEIVQYFRLVSIS